MVDITKLKVVTDSGSIPLWGRRISNNTEGYYTQALIPYSVNIPDEAQILILGLSGSVMISASDFTPPSNPGDTIPNGVLVNPGAIWVEDVDTIYFATLEATLVNCEFYYVANITTGRY